MAACVPAPHQHREVPLPRPDHDGGAVVPALQGQARVAGIVFELLLARVSVVEGVATDDFILDHPHLTELTGVAVAVRPVARGQAGVDDVSHLVLATGVVIVVVGVSGAVASAAPVRVIGVVVVDVAELPQGDQGKVRDAAGLLSRLEQHLRPRAVGALEPVRREPVPCVLVLQRHHALLRLVRFLARLPPSTEKLCDPGRDRTVGRCAEPLPAARPGERHVVGKAKTIAAA